MAKAHVRGATRPSQPETTHFDQASMLHLAILSGGGYLPRTGDFTPEFWAKTVGKSVEYVENVFVEHGMTYRRFGGDLRYSAAEEVYPLLPEMTAETDPKRQHGGKRK